MFLKDIYSPPPPPSVVSLLFLIFFPSFAITQSKGIEWEATCEQLQMPQCQHAWLQAIQFIVMERELDWMVHFWRVQWFVFVCGSVKTTI